MSTNAIDMNVITFNLDYDKPNMGSAAPLNEIIEKILSLPLSETFKTSFCDHRADCIMLECTHAHNEAVNVAGKMCRDMKLADKNNRFLQNGPTEEAIEKFNIIFDNPKAKVYVKPQFISKQISSRNLPERFKTTMCDKAENCKKKTCRFAHQQVVFNGGNICQQNREEQRHQANNSPQMQNAIAYNPPTIDPLQTYLATMQSLMNGMNQQLMSMQHQLQMSYQEAPPQYSEINNIPQNFIPVGALNVQYQNPPTHLPPQSPSPVQLQEETAALDNDTLQNLSNLQLLQNETAEVDSETWESWQADLNEFKEQP